MVIHCESMPELPPRRREQCEIFLRAVPDRAKGTRWGFAGLICDRPVPWRRLGLAEAKTDLPGRIVPLSRSKPDLSRRSRSEAGSLLSIFRLRAIPLELQTPHGLFSINRFAVGPHAPDFRFDFTAQNHYLYPTMFGLAFLSALSCCPLLRNITNSIVFVLENMMLC